MPTLIDAIYVFLLLVVATVFEHYYFWPRFRAETAANLPDARIKGYRRGIIGQWGFAVLAIAIWAYYARTAATLKLTAPSGWRLVVSAVLVVLMIALVLLQYMQVSRLSLERRIKARPRLGAVAFLLPHSRREHRVFLLLSLTAGFCEELLYRGYLVWFLATWLGTPGAYVAVVALFGIGHAYQGRKGAVRATAAGAVMTGIVMITGWLVPAMIIHALVDAGSGTVGYMILSASGPTEAMPQSPDSHAVAV